MVGWRHGAAQSLNHTTELTWKAYFLGGPEAASGLEQRKKGRRGKKGLPFMRGHNTYPQGMLYLVAAAVLLDP